MLLYRCPECGRWQDVSVAEALNKAVEPLAKWAASVSKVPYEEPLGYPCPAGHGLMVQVMPHERIFVRASTVEQARIEEGSHE